MKYPDGWCESCGGRLSGHVEGGYQCLNCSRRYPSGVFDRDDEGGRRRKTSGDAIRRAADRVNRP